MADLDEGNEWPSDVEATMPKEKLKQLKGDINLLIAKLEVAPQRLRDLSEIGYEGWMYMTKGGKLNWKKFFAQLVGDVISFFKDPNSEEIKYQGTICFYHMSKVTEEDKLTGQQVREGLFCRKRIKLILHGEILDLSFESDDMANKWNDKFQELLKLKFRRDELRDKEEARLALAPLLMEQQNLLFEKYNAILKALSDSGFWIGKEKKIREGLCYLKRRKKSSRKLYCVLYKDFFYMFKPQARVSINERPYALINLKFITAIDIEGDKLFSVTTALRKYVFGCKHDEAMNEWVNQLRLTTSKKNKALPPMKKVAPKMHDNGYRYSKDISKKLSIIETFEDGKQKSHKIKLPSSTVGRSSSCTIRLTSDKYVSRSHCKFIVVNNIPYVIDLGQSKGGTKVNQKKITKCALKPGDIISIGKSDLVFQVKDGISIFSHFQKPQNSKESESEHDDSPLLPSDYSDDEINTTNNNKNNNDNSDDDDDNNNKKHNNSSNTNNNNKKKKKEKNKEEASNDNDNSTDDVQLEDS